MSELLKEGKMDLPTYQASIALLAQQQQQKQLETDKKTLGELRYYQ